MTSTATATRSIDDHAAALAMANSKDALAQQCRAAGWSGDDARTPKMMLARWLAEHEMEIPHSTQAEPAPFVQHTTATEAKPEQQQLAPAATVKAQPSPVKAGQGDNIAGAVAQGIAAALGALKLGVDEDAVNAIIDARLQAIEPAKIILREGAADVRIEGHTHPIFEKVLRLTSAGVNVLIVGPAGCGKSFLAHQIAKALGRSFGTLHCSAGVSESQVTGWLLPTGDGGRFEFVPSQFATLYAEGNSVFLIDEIDAADPNMLTVLNGALANGALHIPQCASRPEWKRGADAAIIAAANTYGTGADMLYVGRNQLDAATLDRFYVVRMDYDAALEHSIAGLPHTPGKSWEPAATPAPSELQRLGEWVLALRQKATAAKLRRIVSTRTMQKAIAARCAGIPTAEVQADILAGWTADEIAKVEA